MKKIQLDRAKFKVTERCRCATWRETKPSPGRVFVLEHNGRLRGPFAAAPEGGRFQTVHEVAGHVHSWDRSRDWFECPWCRSEVTGEELALHEGGHECDETTLGR